MSMCFYANPDDVIADMQEILEQRPIHKERLRKIDNTDLYANSVNVYVGRPRSGKTFQALHDVISMVRNDPCVHMLVYINESGQIDDDTFERFEELITTPIIYVKYADYEKFLKRIAQYKNIYNRIKDTNLPLSEIPDDVRKDLFKTLCISDFSRPHLHTLIMTEDATNAKELRKADSYINDLLTRCAHTQFSFFILIHYWKALTTNIKANLSTIYIFGGYSRQQLTYMLYQMNIPASINEIAQYYSQMPRYGKLIIDCNECDFMIV